MVRRSRTRTVDRVSAGKYRQVGRAFLDAADALSMVAGEDETYGNAIGLLSIHAAIAYADTVSIAYGERKSTAGDHEQAVTVLRSVLGARLPSDMDSLLLSLVKAKDGVAYQGKYYPLRDGQRLLDKASRFAQWADRLYQQRP
jgi:hypothetical protein